MQLRFSWRRPLLLGAVGAAVAACLPPLPGATAGWPGWPWRRAKVVSPACDSALPGDLPAAGSWHWVRSPEQEQRVVAALYNRYCIRCHAVDGRGVWDIPDVPDLTNARWQATRSDAQLARAIVEGRGAVMPAFRGTLTLEESWAVARYLRSFIPGTEASRPDTRNPEKKDGEKKGEEKKEGEKKGGEKKEDT